MIEVARAKQMEGTIFKRLAGINSRPATSSSNLRKGPVNLIWCRPLVLGLAHTQEKSSGISEYSQQDSDTDSFAESL